MPGRQPALVITEMWCMLSVVVSFWSYFMINVTTFRCQSYSENGCSVYSSISLFLVVFKYAFDALMHFFSPISLLCKMTLAGLCFVIVHF